MIFSFLSHELVRDTFVVCVRYSSEEITEKFSLSVTCDGDWYLIYIYIYIYIETNSLRDLF